MGDALERDRHKRTGIASTLDGVPPAGIELDAVVAERLGRSCDEALQLPEDERPLHEADAHVDVIPAVERLEAPTGLHVRDPLEQLDVPVGDGELALIAELAEARLEATASVTRVAAELLVMRVRAIVMD
jgi:hypothetical protein